MPWVCEHAMCELQFQRVWQLRKGLAWGQLCVLTHLVTTGQETRELDGRLSDKIKVCEGGNV
jgi:hypothetical protein